MAGTAIAAESGPGMGNGENNWIKIENTSRIGNVLVIPEVKIAQPGWLVVHPFKNGRPNGDIYVGASYLKEGVSKDVPIEVFRGIESGEKLMVMLHSDRNRNKAFDFVFIDERNVMDLAVFEGNKIIGRIYTAP